MSKLAIDGGEKVFAESVNLGGWPPVYPETAEKLAKLYMSQKWSFYGAVEMAFSANFAKYHDAKFGTFMVNGTATLETALKALGVGPGDEVIVPSWTWMATGMAPLYVGATPVFVDGDKATFCMDPEAFEAYESTFPTKEKTLQPGQLPQFCQSCGMPLTCNEDCGHDADGSINFDYCKYCYDDGRFLQDCTMDEMIEHCSQFVDEVN